MLQALFPDTAFLHFIDFLTLCLKFQHRQEVGIIERLQ